ncbi:ABC transporter substrate-binding protein [Deinococcus sp. SDU3-2]|uniref:ABC transporter substrate-binding protein n=1 Tax=Deinococcus terrestris TaxID=2651870 RepID=A0A7X1NV41_9DEIO|nr:ABC transporter substrate-binding protein [Deinococcus terrestris]MPY66213.1 ABC transporter substrate-binding protein [Deinococcus terrestris]
MRKDSRTAPLFLALSLGLLSACGGGQRPQPNTTDFVFPAAWTVSSPAEVKRGGTLRNSAPGPSLTLNPFRNAQANSAVSQLSDAGLLKQDPVTEEFVPYMAQAYTVSADGLTWEFTLRPDLKWSDGQPITPKDFVTTARIHQDQAVGSNSYDTLRGVTVSQTGDRTVRIVFQERQATTALTTAFTPWPDHIFGAAYTSGGAAAIRALWPVAANPASIVVSGPFKLASLATDGAAVLERNPFYGEWAVDSAGQPLPYLDRVELVPVSSTDAQLSAFLAGRIDLFSPAPTQLAALRGAANVVLRENYSGQASSSWIVWNWNRASDPEKQRLFRSSAFRQAMSHLTDRERMVREVLGGAGEAVYTNVYPVFAEWISPTAPRFNFNVAEARRLLAGLGYDRANADGYLINSAGRVLEFDLITNAGNTARENYARIFAEGARQAGVKVNAQAIDFNVIASRLASTGDDRPFDAILLGLSGGSNIWPFGVNVVPCNGNLHAYNRSGGCLTDWEREADRLFQEGNAEPDRTRRLALGRQLQDLEAQHQPFVYLVAPKASVAWRSRVRGEYPAAIADADVGTRELVLTWVQD